MHEPSLKVHHFGISVANLSEAIEWYQKHLDCTFLWQNDFPMIQTQIAFLQHGDFRIELFEHWGQKNYEVFKPHSFMI